MSDRDQAEALARMAAAMRVASKAETNRQIVEALHPPEPEPQSEADAERERDEFMAGLFKPKGWQAELIRSLHPDKDEG